MTSTEQGRLRAVEPFEVAWDELVRQAIRLAAPTGGEMSSDPGGATVTIRSAAMWERERGCPGSPPDAVIARLVADERGKVTIAIASALSAALEA